MKRKAYWIIGLIAILSIIFISGCVKQVSEKQLIKVALDSPFQLKVGQTAVVDSENLKISFLNVTADSRCPSNVMCFWEGEAVISVSISEGDKDLSNFNLSTYGQKETVGYGGYFIKLLKVEPYPATTKIIDISDYNVTLIVSKTNQIKDLKSSEP